MAKRDIVRKYLQENYIDKGISLDKVEKQGIARLIFKAFPKHFSSVDNARDAVRAVMGQHGVSTKFRDPTKQKFYGDAFYSWAEQVDEEDRPWDHPFIIPKATKHLVIAADFHSKHCVKGAVEWMLKRTKDKSA